MIRKEIHNTFWQFFEKSLKLFGQLIAGIVIARLFGPEEFGRLNYIISLVFVFFTLSAFGMENVLVRRMVQHPDQTSNILSSAFLLRCVSGIVLYSALLFTAFLLLENNESFWMVVVMGLQVLLQPLDVIRIYFQSQLKSKLSAVSLNVAFLIAVFLRLYFAYQGDILLVAATYSIEIFVQGVILVYLFKGREISLFRPKMKIVGVLFKESLPLAFSSLFYLVYVKIDQLMLAGLTDYQEVGFYSVAARLSEAWYFIPTAIVSSVFPAIVVLKDKNPEKYKAHTQTVLNLLTTISVMVFVVISATAFWIIPVIYGEEYLPVIPVLQLHVLNGVLVFGGILAGAWLVNENLQHITLYRTILGASANIVLNYFLIPIAGAMGATVATLVSRFLVAFVLYYFFARTRVLFFMLVKSYWGVLSLNAFKDSYTFLAARLKGEKNTDQ